MTVNARSDNMCAVSAKPPLVELRAGGTAIGGSYVYEGAHLHTAWHRHDVHQIEYAISGVVEVTTAAGSYLLPPQQAAWLPAGLGHSATMGEGVKTIAVMFDPTVIPNAGDRARIIAVSALVREMMIYALKWPIERARGDSVSDNFFRTLGHLVSEAIENEEPLSLPTCDHPVVADAMRYTKDNLSMVTVDDVSRAVAVSPRTLRRHFQEEVGLSWRTYLLHARLLRAMALLASADYSVHTTAAAVGFDNISSFSRAFLKFCGETPSAYRARLARSALESTHLKHR